MLGQIEPLSCFGNAVGFFTLEVLLSLVCFIAAVPHQETRCL